MQNITSEYCILTCTFWWETAFSFPTLSVMLKPKAFFSQVSFGVDYKPLEVRDSFFSHGHLWLAHPNIVPASKRFVEWRNDCPAPPHPPPQTLGTAIKNSKAKIVFLTFFLPPDIRKQNKTSKQTERFKLDLLDLARGWQLELRFQQRLTKAASGARERLSQNLSVIRGCDSR